MNLTSIIGLIASILTSISLLPQLIKIVKEKEAENISLGMLAVLLAGLILWTIYGFMIKDNIIMIANGFSVIVTSIVMVLSIYYKKK